MTLKNYAILSGTVGTLQVIIFPILLFTKLAKL